MKETDKYLLVGILSVIALCLILITYKLYTFTIFDVVPPQSELTQAFQNDDKDKKERLATMAFIIDRGIIRFSDDSSNSINVNGKVDVSGSVTYYQP